MASRYTSNIRIRPIAYNFLSEPDSSITTSEAFRCNQRFLIVSSRAIPRVTPSYIEVIVSQYKTETLVRHIPLFLGIHKDPYVGVTANDCAFGSIYYTREKDFHTFEKKRGETTPYENDVGKLGARIPIVDTVIGLGVDPIEETISIYSNGALFYKFHPTNVNIRDSEEPWYFAVFYDRGEYISGKINYGRYKCKYLPAGYVTLYQYYFDTEYYENNNLFTATMTVDGMEYTGQKYYEINSMIEAENQFSNITTDNKILPHLEYNKLTMRYADNDHMFKMNHLQAWNANEDPDLAYVSLPCPNTERVYLELTVKEGELLTDIIGIPIEIGIANDQTDITDKSFRIRLFRYRGGGYLSASYQTGIQQWYDDAALFNPAAPVQPRTIGIIFDLPNSMIYVITEGTIFAEFKIQGVDFNDPYTAHWIFFRSAEVAYSGYCLGEVNFGEDTVETDLDTLNCKSFYDYWNDALRFPWSMDILCRMKVRPYRTTYNVVIWSKMYVAQKPEYFNYFENGLNMLYDTFNMLTEEEAPNNVPALNAFDFNAAMKEDLKNISKKYGDFDILECTLKIYNPAFDTYATIDGLVSLEKAKWFDLDCEMNVRIGPGPSIDYDKQIIFGMLRIAKSNYKKGFLNGRVNMAQDELRVSFNCSTTVAKENVNDNVVDGSVELYSTGSWTLLEGECEFDDKITVIEAGEVDPIIDPDEDF